MAIITGNYVGRYEVLGKLGSGGMGEVYKVYDAALDRPVALKILPADLVEDEERLRRFVQEAKSASGLNHPHIVTIYEIGQVQSESAGEEIAIELDPSDSGSGSKKAVSPGGTRTIHYIAMEFIDGDTLRARIHRDRTELKKLLEFLAQVADGLAKAHAAGIVHRDLKPDNIMITPDSYAKILDFGLAKLVEPRKQITGDSTEAATALMEYTQPGMVMGTLGYMSPEQVQGKAVDQRSDIFSFGCILYEAATGHKPFEGDSLIDTLHKIVYAQAPPLRDFNPEAPAELQRIIRKCLAKDPDQRYQSIKDVAIDLRELIKEFDSQTSVAILYNSTTSYPSMPTVSTSGPVELRKPGRKAWWIAFTALAFVLFVAGTFALLKLIAHKQAKNNARRPFEEMRLTRLTATGKAGGAAISPDGKYVAHIVDEAGRQSIWIKQIATNSNVQIVPPADVGYWAATFSPDGNYVYYLVHEKNSPVRLLFRVPTLGGDPRKLIVDIDSPISFSPDGKRLAFVRQSTSSEESALMVANADGTEEQKLAARKSPDFFLEPAWSPDGKAVVCSEGGKTTGITTGLIEVRIEDGTERPLGSQRWLKIPGIAWLSDGKGLIVAAQEQGGGSQVWHVSYPDGKSRRVTNDLSNYFGMSLAADSSNLVTIQSERISNIWVVPGGDATRARQITTGVGKYNGLCWAPDGRIIYGASATGEPKLWVMNADGTGQKQLTTDSGIDIWPTVTPDGRYIVFQSHRAGSSNIWRMNIDGSNPKQLTDGIYNGLPQTSPDGQWVIYTSHDSGKPTLWKVSINGGDATQLTDKFSYWPAISPDGKLIACIYWNEQLDSREAIAIIPIEGGQPIKTFAIPSSAALPLVFRWSPDGRALNYIDNRDGVFNIWSQPLAGGAPKQVTSFSGDRIFRFDWSRDAKQLICSRGTVTSDVVLMSEIK